MNSDGLYDILDQRFAGKIHGSAKLEELYSECRWAEGPVWFSDHDCLYFSDIPNQRMMRYLPGDNSVTTFRNPSNFTNGHTRDRQGRLVSCEHGTRRVTRTEWDGTITVIADSFDGKRLNSPNDVVVASDGAIWFTDPSYGIMSDYEGYQAPEEQSCRGVYRVDGQTGEINRVVEDFLQPNGLAFSPDEKLLYIADSGSSHDANARRQIRVFDVADGKRLANGREFAQLDYGVPDGFRVDNEGWVWTSGGPAVHVFDPQGALAGRIRVPQTVSNLTFGGQRRNRLFITATQSLYAIYVNARGAAPA
jgi:gluconolactonase